MPALARRLKCGVMSIYGHVESKEDLLEAVAERAFAELALPQPLPDGSRSESSRHGAGRCANCWWSTLSCQLSC